MKRISNLFNAVLQFENFVRAAYKASQGKRHKPPVARFLFHLEPELLNLLAELENGTYKPGRYVVFEIRDPKRRRICAAPFRDRVVHHAICNVLEPYFEKRLIFDTYACRKGKGVHAAIQRAQQFARCYPYFLKCDIKRYFESIDHTVLLSWISRFLKDDRLLSLLKTIIDHSPPYTEPGIGLPIGNLTSQHFANLYLSDLDHTIKDRKRIKGYVRYMDDLLLFGMQKETLRNHLSEIVHYLRSRLRLELKETSVILAPVNVGLPFLGVSIFPGTVRLSHRSIKRFRRKLKSRENAYLCGAIDDDRLSSMVSALFGHIRHTDTCHLRRNVIRHTLNPG